MIVKTKQKEYPLIIQRGSLFDAATYLKDKNVTFIVTDDGVPQKWVEALVKQFPLAMLYTLPQGEASKSIHYYQDIIAKMLEHQVSRNDTLIALGGGVVGDLAGFVSATYMRGIEFVNIPTTTLSQIDSSIGGKTAIDFGEVKNCVGAFWQPSMVIVDPDVLETLSQRHYNNGLAEAVKEALIKDAALFELFENEDAYEKIDEIIEKCLMIKKEIVENDERESGERKLLNFGHTYGHAYESYYDLDTYLHGECVAMGMMSILKNKEIKQRLEKVLKKLNLPTSCDADIHQVIEILRHDKKADHDEVTIVQVDEIGKGHLEKWSIEELRRHLEDE